MTKEFRLQLAEEVTKMYDECFDNNEVTQTRQKYANIRAKLKVPVVSTP